MKKSADGLKETTDALADEYLGHGINLQPENSIFWALLDA